MKAKQRPFFLVIVLAFLLVACSAEDEEGQHAGMGHVDPESMDHSSSGDLPEGLQQAEKATFEIGSQVVLNSDHMERMDGTEATIVGAFHTTVYAVSYTPTTGGERVANHKWVIHEELRDAGDEPYQTGDKVTLGADHMKGMDGAEAIIDSAEQTTVYMVDYLPAAGGEPVKNHKWVTENELSAEGMPKAE